MTPPDTGMRQVFATAAALLGTGRSLDALSRALTVVAFAALLLPLVATVEPLSLGAISVSAAAGLATLHASARVAFDAALFASLANGAGDLAGLDDALAQLALVPAERAGRPMADRFAGARRLMARQATLLGVQAAGLLAAGWLA